MADLGGQTLSPGVYNSASSLGLTGALTLDGGGDPNAVFVFQAGSTLTTSSASQVDMVNGAQSCNVFWQVGSSATLGGDSRFGGTIMALTNVTVTNGASIDGRVLAVNGTVTLDTDTIMMSTCTSPPATTNPAPAIGEPQGGKNSGATKGASQTLPVGATKASDNAHTVPTNGTTNPTPSTTGSDLGGGAGTIHERSAGQSAPRPVALTDFDPTWPAVAGGLLLGSGASALAVRRVRRRRRLRV